MFTEPDVYQAAMMEFAAGHTEKALEKLGKAPDGRRMLTCKGFVHYVLGEYGKAAESFAEAQKNKKEHASPDYLNPLWGEALSRIQLALQSEPVAGVSPKLRTLLRQSTGVTEHEDTIFDDILSGNAEALRRRFRESFTDDFQDNGNLMPLKPEQFAMLFRTASMGGAQVLIREFMLAAYQHRYVLQ